MPDLSDYQNGITRCTASKWEEQKDCILKRVEKSAYRNCCMWMAVNGYNVCTNPDAGKWEDGVQ